MHTARSQDTGGNLYLKDEKLYKDQLKTRESKSKNKSLSVDIKIGDTVTPISPQDKHRVREIYLVTGQEKYQLKDSCIRFRLILSSL